jgi:fibronectin-binding autotransporter adhesin
MKDWWSAPRARKFVARPQAVLAPVEVSITRLGKVRWAFRLALLAGTCLAPLGAQAQFASDTWKTAPTDGQYNNAANWVGGNIPASSSVGTLYTATFGTSSTTTIAVAAPSPPELYVGSFQFNAGASAYTFNVADGTNLRFHGAGIVNNSSNAPTFNLNGSSSNLWLGSAAKAGNAIINITNGGDLLLGDTASAENAVINVTGSNSAGIEMFGGTLGDATVTLAGDGSTGLVLRQTASGGSARVIANGGSINIVNLTGAGTTLGSLAGASTSFNVNLGSKQLTVGGNNDSTSFAGRLNGSGGSIGKAGTGTWTLTNGTHTYDGLTTISGGTLALSGNGNLANSSGIDLTSSGTTFEISAANGNRTIKDLSGVAGSAVVLGTRTLSVDTANNATFAGDISGTGGLTKQGSGTLTLSGSNAYTGATTITDGTLALSGSGNIGASSGVDLTGATARFDISASGGSTAIKSLAGVAGSTVSLGANSLAVGNASSTTFAGVIDGSGGGLIKQGTGTLTLTAVNTYAGATQINGGTLALSGSGSIALSNSLTLDGTGASTVFDISQTSGGATIGSLFDVPSGPPPASTAVVRLGSKTLTITDVTVFAGTITDGGIGGGSGGGLTIAGAGGAPITAALSGTHTYTGATTIGANATFELDDNGSISNSSVVNLTGAGAVFDISCGCLNPQTIKDLQGVTGTTVRLGDNSLTVGTANSTTFEGIIDAYFGASGPGTGGLIKQGAGTLTLTDVNTYIGATTINGGTLALSGSGSIAASSGVDLASAGARFDISGSSGGQTIQDLAGVIGAFVVLGANTLTAGTANSTSFAGVIEGSGGFTKQGTGTLTFSGVNTYTGVTTVSEGTLALSGGGSIAASSGLDLSGAGATFDISASSGNQTIQDLSGVGSALVALGGNSLTVGSSNSTTFDGTIDGSGGLTKQGSGTLTLGGANTYTGATTINAGTLALTNIGAIQDSAKVTVAAGAFFDLSGVTGYAKVQTVDGGGTVQLGDSGLEITNGSTEFSGVITSTSGSGGLRIAGGILTLSGVSTYSSLTTLQQGATLALKGAGSIASSSSIEFQAVAAGNATFDISQTTTGTSVSALNETRSSIGVVALGSKELVLTGTTTDFLGTITDGGIGGGVGGRLTLATGAGATLGGVNTYTGATTIGDGATLRLAGSGSIEQSSEVNLAGAAAIFDIGGIGGVGVATIKSLVGNGTVELGGRDLELSQATGEFAGSVTDSVGIGTLAISGGTLTLTGTSTYTGNTAIGRGATLALKGSGSIAQSATILFDPRGPTVGTFDISQTTTGASVAGLSGPSGVVSLGSKELTITVGSPGFGGVIQDGGIGGGAGGSLRIATGAAQVLTGANTYTGPTTVESNAFLVLEDSGSIALSSSVNLMGSNAGLDISCSCLSPQTIRNLTSSFSDSIVFMGDTSLTVISTADTTFAGILESLGGIGGLIKEGGATLTLSGSSSYTGGTTINAGAVSISSDANLGDAAGVLVFGGGTLKTTADIAMSRATTLNAGGGTFDVALGTALVQGGVIDGAGALTKIGGGTLVLEAVNSYTGATAISAGTLALANGGRIAASSEVTIASGATFDIANNSFVNAIKSLSGAGDVQLGANVLRITDGAPTSEFSGRIDDGGAFGGIQVWGGQLTLSGESTFSGPAEIRRGGTLALKGSGSMVNAGVQFHDFGIGVATFDISQTSSGASILGLIGDTGVVSLGSKELTITIGSPFFAGVIQDGGIAGGTGGSLRIASLALQVLSGANTYTGETTIEGFAYLALDQNGSIASSSGLNLAGAGAAFDVSCSCLSAVTVQNLSGETGSFVALGNTKLTVLSSRNTEFEGIIAPSLFGDSGTGGLIKAGSGMLTLSGINTYIGGTTINGGAISISSDSNLGAATGRLAFGGGTLRTTDDISMSRATTLNAGGGTFDVAVGTTLTQSGIIDGSGNLTKIGAGTLQLTVASTYVGDTTISAGTLALAGNGNISSSNLVTVASGATLQLVGSLAPPAAIRNLAGNGAVQFLGRGLEITNASGEFAGSITGNGSLTLSGGTMTLTGASTYSGSTTIAQGATLALKGTGSVPSPSFVYFGSAGGSGLAVLDISQTAAGVSVGALDDSASPGSGVVNLGNKTLTLTRAGGASAVVIQDGGLGGGTGGGVTLAANAQQRLAGINTYTGVTTVGANATLWMTDAGSIALSSRLVLAAAGAVFDTSNSTTDQTIQDLEGVTGSAVRIGGTLAVGTSNSTTFAGVVAGAGNLTKQGGGTLTLSSINTYTGATTITGGTLALSGAGSIAASSGVNLAAGGARFDISGANGGRTIQDLTGVAGTSVVLGGNSLTVGTANNTSFAGNISGTGGLTKQGSGTLTLLGTNTYSGVTTVSGGTLVGNSTSLQGNIVNNAAVVFNQSSDGTYAGNMSGSGSLTKTGSGNLTLTGTNTYVGGTTVSAGTLTGTTTSLQGDITNNAAVVFNQTTSGTYAGVISGTGSLAMTGPGTVILTNSNSYGGGTTISDGVLQLGNGGTTGMITGNVVVSGNGTLAFNRSDAITFAGDISGTGGIMLMGPGTVALTGTNTFSGGTAIGGGIVQVASDAAFGAANTTLKIGGGATVQALASFTSGRPVTLIGIGGKFDTNGNTLTLEGPITGGGALTKTGVGTLILTGTNTYSGGTTVEAGTVQGNTASLQGAITNNASVVFDQGTDGTYAGAMSGTGGLTKAGAGNLTLTGVNSYTGNTTVSGGTLTGSTTSLQGNIGVASNATVAFNQTVDGVYNGVLSGGGALVKIGSGNLTLTGANTYSGGTTVAGGTLTGTTTSLQGNIVNNATVAFDQGINGTYAGNMSGSGGFVKNGTGTVILAGTNSYSGGTTVNGGVLQLGAGNLLATGSALTVNGGTFDFNGNSQTVGALSGAGGAIALGSGTLTASSADNATLASAIGGNGSFVKMGSGTLTLTGASTYTGGTTVNEGTLQLGTGGALAAKGALTITGGTFNLDGNSQTVGALSGSGGTIALGGGTLTTNSASNTTLASAITGSGSFVKQGSGTLTLTGANSYAGGTTVSGGTLVGNTTSLQGNILNNAAVVFDQASNGVYGGALSGSGTLTKTGAGLLNLTGNSVVGGGTTVSAGTLAVNGSLTSNVTVGAGGAIGGTGTITGLLALSGGTLAPGNSIGTLNVTGNFTQTGGVYQVEANAGGQSDKIVATGTAAISGGTTVQVLAAQGVYQRSTTYTILSATGGLTGTYGGITSNLAFLTPSLSYDANNAFLTLELLQNAFSFGGLTPNQRAVGRTLDTAFSGAAGDFATVLSAMTGLSTAQGPAVLDTISGQPYASFGTVNVLANFLFMNTVGQQMALVRSGGPGATRVALAEACEVACDMQEPTRWGAWFSGLGGAGNVGGNYNAGGLTYNLGGAAVGVDYRIDPRFLVGLAFGYSSGRQWVSGFQGLGTTDNYSAVLYASFTQGGFYADALAGYAYSDNRQQRVMQIPGLSTRYANGGAGANQFLGQIEAGYKIGFGLTETARASVTPFARFQTVAASQKGFSEWGADSLNLNVQQQNTTSIRTVLGADLAASVPLGTDRALGITLRLGWAHDYGDTARPMTAAFAGAPTVPFTIVGAQPMRDSAVVGFGLSTRITDSISAYARYDGELNGRDDNHNFSAGFRMTW